MNPSANSLSRPILKKRLKTSLTTFLLLTLGAAPLAALAQIPDDIDFRKYETLYNQAKQASDAKRAAADQAASDLRSAEANLQNIDANLQQQRQAIVDAQNAINVLNQEIANLRAQNQVLSGELNRHQSDLSGARLLADREGQRAQELRSQLAREQQSLDALNAQYQRELQAYQVVQGRLATATQERDAAGSALQTTQSRIQQVEAQLQRAQNDLQSSTARVRELELLITNIQPQLNSVQSELSGVEQSLRAGEAQLASFYERERVARAAYDTARGALSGAQARVSQAESALQANRSEQSTLNGNIGNLERSIQANQSELDNLSRNLEDAQRNLSNLENENRSIDSRMPELVSQIGALRLRQGELGVQFDRKRAELEQVRAADPNDPRIPGLQSEVDQLGAERNSVGQQRLGLEAEKRGLDSRKTELVGQISSTRSQIATLQSKASSLPGTIASLKQQLDSSRSRLSTLASQEGSLASAVEQARSGLSGLQAEVSAKEATLNVAVRERQQAEAPLEPLRNRQRELSARRDGLSRQLNDSQNELTNQRVVAQNARSQVQQLGVDIGALRGALPNLQATYEQKARAVDTFTVAVQDAYRRSVAAQQTAERQGSIVAQVQQALSQSEEARRSYLAQVQSLESAIQQKSQLIAQNDQRAREDANQMAQYQRALPEMQRVEAQLVQSRNATASQIASLQSSYATLDQTARILEAETARRYSVYQDRLAKFEIQAADARRSGSEQGDRLGRADGGPKGDTDGTRDGKARGTQKGIEDGLAYGLNAGRADGDAKGYPEGKAKGLASAADYQAGYALGLASGKKSAQEEATRIDYPKGKSDRKAAILATIPARTIDLDNNAAPIPAGPLGVRAEFVKPELASNTEVVFRLDRDVDRSILRLLPRPTPACNQIYAEFKKACVDSFNAAYDSAYQSVYADAYARSFQVASDAAFRIAFEANKNVKYAEGHKLGLAEGTARGLNDGKIEANNKGLADGQRDGYQQVIAGLKASEYARGVKEIDDAFAVNPYVDVRDGAFEKLAGGSAGPSIIVGDRLSLALKVANLGAKNSARSDIKITAEAASPNVAVENAVVQLASIPTGTLANVKNILSVKILPGAAGGGQEKVKLRWNNSEGVMQEKIVSITVSAAITGRINELQYDSSPRQGKIQAMKVSVSNTSKVAPVLPVTIQLSTAEPAGDVTINAATVKVNPFPANTTWLVGDLNYTINNKDALKRGVVLKVRLLHGGSVISEQDVLIKK